MRTALAIIAHSSESSRPDIAWIRKNVPVLEVGKALGLRIRHRRTRCWRPENHAHGDAEPSLHFYEARNRVRCFVCDMRGGHSNVDLVMGVLNLNVGDAVCWIAERFPVPNVKPGRPVGKQEVQAAAYRVGVHSGQLEFLVRSGMFGKLPAPERSILVALTYLRDPDSGLTQLSYAGIMRYAGLASTATVAKALKQLARLHAIEIHPGLRVGVTRSCSAYRVTVEDPKFVSVCNEIFRISREQVAQERAYRQELRSKRQQQSPTPKQNSTPLRPPLSSPLHARERLSTCEGLNLSSVGEVQSSKTLQSVKRKTGFSGPRSIEEQKQILRERGLL